MRIVQTKGTIKNGELTAFVPPEFKEGDVSVIVVANNEPDEFEEMRQIAQARGYDSPEKIMELIHQVKLEMLTEKGRVI